jgi:hypothetical protein
MELEALTFHVAHYQPGVRPDWADILRQKFPDLRIRALTAVKLCSNGSLDVDAVLTVYDAATGRVCNKLQRQVAPTVGGIAAETEGAALYLLAAQQGTAQDTSLRQLAVASRKLTPPELTPKRKRDAWNAIWNSFPEERTLQRFPRQAAKYMLATDGRASPITRRCLSMSVVPKLRKLGEHQART